MKLLEQGAFFFTIYTIMIKLLTETALLVATCASLTAAIPSGKFVANIDACPALSPRSPPTSIHDLRPDDIKVIGALGDRYTYKFLLPLHEHKKKSITEINFVASWQVTALEIQIHHFLLTRHLQI